MTKIQILVTAFTSLNALRRILLEWKSPLPPSFKSWIGDIMSLLKLDKYIFLRGSSDKFCSHWQSLISYLEPIPAGDFSQ